jgi:hypothetical protein
VAIDRDAPLSGTTLRVYRYIYRSRSALGIRDIQRGLGLSSPSVADYHIKKLVSMGLVREEADARFAVNGIVFENMVRIRRSLIPLQIAYVAFFGAAFFFLTTVFRNQMFEAYLFSLIIISLACIIFAWQAARTVHKTRI